MIAVPGYAAVAAELRSLAHDVGKVGDFIQRPDLNAENITHLDWIAAKLHELANEAAVLLAAVAATLPDCPRCGGTGWIPDAPRHAILLCPDCSDGKVTVAQLAALWEAVHDPDDTTRHMHDAFSLLEQLRSVRPVSPDREPQPSDGPDYHADHRAWMDRQ